MSEFTALEYFPGGNTPYGFYSYYSDVLDPKLAKREIILKGGPGTGKSTLMKRVAARLIEDGHTVEYLHCSSDPDSLDAVVARELGVWIVDGTSPHTQDPIYPGAVEEIVNLGAYWDAEKIALHHDDILLTQAEISACFAQAYHYLSAAQDISKQIDDTYKKASSGTQSILEELAASYTPCGHQGRMRRAFLSAITPKGVVNYIDSFVANAVKTVVLESEAPALCANLMAQLSKRITQSGTDSIVFPCAMAPDSKIEHIFLPDTGVFYTTSNSFHSLSPKANITKKFSLNGFIHPEQMPETMQRDRQTYAALIDRAIESIANAKQKHDLLETFYSPYMDFSSTQTLIDSIVNKFEI